MSVRKAGIWLQRYNGHDFEHASTGNGKAVESFADRVFAGRLPQDGCPVHVAALPHLAQQSRGVEFLHAGSFAGAEFGRKCFRRKGIGAAAREREELHDSDSSLSRLKRKL